MTVWEFLHHLAIPFYFFLQYKKAKLHDQFSLWSRHIFLHQSDSIQKKREEIQAASHNTSLQYSRGQTSIHILHYLAAFQEILSRLCLFLLNLPFLWFLSIFRVRFRTRKFLSSQNLLQRPDLLSSICSQSWYHDEFYHSYETTPSQTKLA